MQPTDTTISVAHFGIRLRPIRIAEFSMLAFLSVAMGLPLFFLLIGSFNLAPPGKQAVYGLDSWVRAFSDPGTLSALWMSFLLSTVRLIPAIIFSVLFAWLIARTDMPGGRAVETFCWIAYFVPDFPLTLAWILLLDPNFGFLNTLVKSLPWVEGPLFNPYSFWGIVWVHTSTGGIWFKVMLLVPVFRRLGASLEEAARVSGADTATMLRRITLPVLSPMILAVSVLSFIRGLQSFNTELLLGTPAKIYVYSTRIYDYLQREPRAFGEATALGSMFLVILAVSLFFYWKYLSGERKFTVVTGQGYSTMRVKLGKWRYVALGGCRILHRSHDDPAAALPGDWFVHATVRVLQHRLAVYPRTLAKSFRRSNLPRVAQKQLDHSERDRRRGDFALFCRGLPAGFTADNYRAMVRKFLLDSPCSAGHPFESGCPMAFSRDTVALRLIRHRVGHRIGAHTCR